jgi:EAL and modified HD-GYP domain-containing signal transduction protein
VHVGRQAIYDRDGQIIGYELLFRRHAEAVAADECGAYATSQVILTSITEIGIVPLVGDKMCFVNLTREFIVGKLPLPFDHRQVVLEILETIEIDEEVIAGLADLVGRGYRIALDDFVLGVGPERLLDLATFVKIDLLEADRADVAATVEVCRRHPNVRLVAERLETAAHLELARELGFDLFQGYVLSRPQVITRAALSPSRLQRVELLSLLVNAQFPLARVVSLVVSDPALSLRLLAAANADAMGLPVKVSSVHDAVMLLGHERLRDWATLMLVSDLQDGDEEQLEVAVTRARMCQNLAERMEVPGEAAFTAGLVSAVAEMLGQPAGELALRLSLNDEVTAAVVSGDGPIGELLALVSAYEASDIEALIDAPLDDDEAAVSYLDAIAWSAQIFDQADE